MRMIRMLVIAAAIVAGTTCSDDPSGPTGGRSLNVDVRDNSFRPTPDTVAATSTVTWTWRGSSTHNVIFADDVDNSANQVSGAHQRTFATPGNYDYVCTFHVNEGMTGRIVVE